VYCVRQVVKTPIIILNNPVFYSQIKYITNTEMYLSVNYIFWIRLINGRGNILKLIFSSTNTIIITVIVSIYAESRRHGLRNLLCIFRFPSVQISSLIGDIDSGSVVFLSPSREILR